MSYLAPDGKFAWLRRYLPWLAGEAHLGIADLPVGLCEHCRERNVLCRRPVSAERTMRLCVVCLLGLQSGSWKPEGVS